MNYNKKISILKYTTKYWIAVICELVAIILWCVVLGELCILKKINPGEFLFSLAGILFTIGSFIYAKYIEH